MTSTYTMTDSQKQASHSYRLGQCEVALEFAKKERDSLMVLLGQVAELIENYSEDHNSDSPTDVTVILPALMVALLHAESTPGDR